MNIPDRELISVEGHDWSVQVTDDGSRTLINPDTGVAYHSASGAVAETKSVYLSNSGVEDRLTGRVPTEPDCAITVLEVGLGTGLAMLMSVDLAIVNGVPLHYTAIENAWLGAELLTELQLHRHVVTVGLVDDFLDWRRTRGDLSAPGVHRWELSRWKTRADCDFTLHDQDACLWVESGVAAASFDAIFFDPFAPEQNRELWEPTFLGRMFDLLRPAGRLVTYCVRRPVRDALESVGFNVNRVPGPPGGKREVLVATKGKAAEFGCQSWDR